MNYAFPLQGMRLIEASAGTGKTFTLAALYVRLVLGHGNADTKPAGGQALLPPQILVVTFTKAATAELRDRIRQRLVSAAMVFRGELAADEVLAPIVADYPAAQHAACAAQLQLAAEWMDEAAIFTIHGWCQRMLSEHAFDAGTAFAQNMNNDMRELSLQIARDYWRYFFYNLADQRVLPELGSITQSPETLLRCIQPWLRANDAGVMFQAGGEHLPAAQPPEIATAAVQRWLQQVDELSQQMRAKLPQIDSALALLDAAFEQEVLHKTSYKAEKYWQEERPLLVNWGANPQAFQPLEPATLAVLAKYTDEKLTAKTKKGQTPPNHRLFVSFAEVVALVQQRPQLELAVLHHAAEWFVQEFAKRKLQRAELGFDDLLTRLHSALHGSGGEALAARIRGQFPMAMVDEFQDTDPIQFSIFRKVYPQVQTNEYGLVLVGDPKQAIYSFRGADLHTYLAARELTTGHHYNLPKNYRSSAPLVAAVNALFQAAETRAEGAFGFASGGHNPLPFLPVAAAGQGGRLQEKGMAVPAMNYWLLDEHPSELNKGGYQRFMARQCANRIAQLMQGSQQGEIGFTRENTLTEGLQGITPSDVAILVRDGKEAALIRNELNARGLRSVYMSDKDSIFATEEATTLLAWLQAIYSPDNESRLRAALMLRLAMHDDATLLQWLEDEQAWEHITDMVRELRNQWRSQGVLPMVRSWLHYFDLPSKWLAVTDGERTLTNMLHLAELLQRESELRDGETGLLRWFAQQIDDSSQQEELVQRLESDAERIQVVTIHKSKGLQYKLVFLPFICGHRAVKKANAVSYFNGHNKVVELEADDEAVAKADAERLQEDIRLLYVALTRAVYACWLGIATFREGNAKFSKVNQSGLGAVLGLPAKPVPADVKNALAGLPWQAEAEAPECYFKAAENTVTWQPAARLGAPVLREHWWIASYSALRTGSQQGAADTARLAQLQDDDTDTVAANAVMADSSVLKFNEPTLLEAKPSEPNGMHAFPRGAQAGTFLHGVLEYACAQQFSQLAAAEHQYWLQRRLQLRGWEAHLPALQEWLPQLANVPLQGAGSSLAALPTRVAEMEFWLAVEQVSVAALDTVIQRHIWPESARPALQNEQLNGMLKGFIDLTYEDTTGRYWVCDYKSNWLGENDAAYTAAAMQKTMLSKRYDVQASLYVLALHRLLASRISDYQQRPEAYLGGALYWFIRAPAAGQCVLPITMPLLQELDALFAAAPTGGDKANG